MISGWMELTSSLGGVLGLFDLNQPDSDSSDDEGFEGFGLQSFSLREEEAKSLFEIRPRPNEPIIIEIEDDDEPNVQHPLIQPEIIVPEMKIKQERTESLTKVSKNQAKRKRDVQNRIQDILRELDLPETQLPTALQAKGPWRKSKILTAIDHDVGVITNEIHKFGRKHQVNPQQKILDDASEGQSPYPVPVFNEVDETPFPTQFEWIEKCVYREVVGASIEFLVGCDCSGSCQFGEHCTCAGENHLGGIVYATDGTLVIPPGIPIYECNMKCRCRLDCVNRVVQNPPCFPLEIFKTADRGWGVRAQVEIPRGSFVIEYVGEIISPKEAKKRAPQYDRNRCSYLYDLDFAVDKKSCYSIDAYGYGNVSRFINHSCDPNLENYQVFIHSLDRRTPTVAFFARRSIQIGEELSFNYRYESNGNNYDIKCYCGAPNCKGILF
eukprot:TRINITY_DN6594_c0_g1_i1.p1 TRINITY_DN6594_c0_g1~~TRINITY_DN6594_c0_g1_i1.p1  ORF type:complete len:439 (+),score=74.60 TRINITY_DN6594_c0_g1_i1:653-1969(+)